MYTIKKILKWFIVILLMFVLLLGVIGLISNKFFDNAAMKDACADSGGAWGHQIVFPLITLEVSNRANKGC